jgi:hypothetical protein
MKDGAKRLQPSGRGSDFVIVYAILLCIPFCNVPDFVTSNGPRVITFSFTDQFATHRSPTLRYRGARDKDKYLEFFQTVYFVTSTCDPVLFVRGRQSCRPRGIVASIRDGFEGAISKSGQDIVK